MKKLNFVFPIKLCLNKSDVKLTKANIFSCKRQLYTMCLKSDKIATNIIECIFKHNVTMVLQVTALQYFQLR